MISPSCLLFSTLTAALISTPAMSFVLLGNHKSKLPVSTDNRTASFQYYRGGDVPSLSKKEEIADGLYTTKTDEEMMPILLQIAMDQWNNVRGSYLKMEVVDSNVKLERTQDDHLNVIVVEKNSNASTAAYAMPATNPDDPLEISDCDISISTTPVSALSMLITLTHELGHCVGLGHPHNNFGAIMSYSRTDRSFRLGADDKAGAIFLYPDPEYGGDKTKELISCGNIGAHGSSSAGSVLALLAAPVFLGLLRRRRQYRRAYADRNYP